MRTALGGQVDLVLDGGPCRWGLESTIVSLLDGQARVLRPGALPLAALREALGEAGIAGAGSSAPAPRVPGALTSHYAPATPLEIHAGEGLAIRAESALAEGLRVAVLRRDLGQGGEAAGFAVPQFFLPAQAEAYARALYARLRDIDRAAFDLLLVEAPPRSEDWWAVHGRLARAAGGRGPPTLLP